MVALAEVSSKTPVGENPSFHLSVQASNGASKIVVTEKQEEVLRTSRS